MKALLLLCLLSPAFGNAQSIPDVVCKVEDYPVKAVVAWQFPQTLVAVQVVVLRDPSGEQQARFDLTHGASLISLRYQGKELLFGQTAGASLSLFSTRHGDEADLQGMNPYWSAYSPDQGGSSMGVPATTTGVACRGESSMRAFATMVDRGVDNSFQQQALLGVESGRISGNFPPGYSTPFSIETDASWVPNPGGSPAYYLKLDQTVVNTRPQKTGPMEWYMTAAAPWDFSHYASYPEKCLDKSPCSTTESPALAAGRYLDADQSNGIAIVAPSEGWATTRAYLQSNAEYVVLLYQAVWAAPRRTFAAVMGGSLDGVEGHHFSWFLCAGPWQQALQFAKSRPPSTVPTAPREAELPSTPPAKKAVTIACQATEYIPQPGQTDHAIVLQDPAKEQEVLFDTSQGGAIVSLKYRGVEHVWGSNGGGLLQMAFHNHMDAGAWSGDYNPTQAGDGTANSAVTGIACDGTRKVDFLTTMLDFNHNNGFYPKALIAVTGGRVNDMVPLSYSSPYVLETKADWVENPSATPKYYLRLRERFVHVADEKIGLFDFDFADYEPWEFNVRAISPGNCPCAPGTTQSIAGGWYQDEARTEGLAVAMPANNFPAAKVEAGFNSDYMWRNRSFHLSAKEAVDGIAAKTFVWYAMVGPWDHALQFAHAPHFASTPASREQ